MPDRIITPCNSTTICNSGYSHHNSIAMEFHAIRNLHKSPGSWIVAGYAMAIVLLACLAAREFSEVLGNSQESPSLPTESTTPSQSSLPTGGWLYTITTGVFLPTALFIHANLMTARRFQRLVGRSYTSLGKDASRQ